jgi:spore germination cell wall hydrolase CwlJ-like protein
MYKTMTKFVLVIVSLMVILISIAHNNERINLLEADITKLNNELKLAKADAEYKINLLSETQDWQITETNNRIDSAVLELSNHRILLSNEELERFYKLVMAEAGGENIETQRAVASVVINRILTEQFPDSLKAVMNQRGQFSVMTDGGYGKHEVTDSVRTAVRDALLRDYSDGALYFLNVELAINQGYEGNANSMLNNLEYVDKIGNVTFLK